MKKTPVKFTSEFGIISIRAGRRAMLGITKKNLEPEVTITGRVTGPWGGDDGIDQDFSMTITGFKVGKPTLVPKDKIGRAWAVLRDVKVGDKLANDGGSICIPGARMSVVCADPKHKGKKALYVACSDGKHFLSGHLGDTPETKGALVGFYPVRTR